MSIKGYKAEPLQLKATFPEPVQSNTQQVCPNDLGHKFAKILLSLLSTFIQCHLLANMKTIHYDIDALASLAKNPD